MSYILWHEEHGALMRVDAEAWTAQLRPGEVAIPCEADAPLEDAERWAEEGAARLRDGPGLDEMKAAKLAELADARWRAETSGTELGGMRIATDRESQAMITGAALQATIDPSYVCRWKTSGGFVDLDAQTILGAAMAIRSWVQGCFDREAELADAVAASSTKEEVAAIGWDAAPAPRKAAKKAK